MASEQKHIISPENLGLWTAAALVLALLALVVALVAIYRVGYNTAVIEAQVLTLNSKIEEMKGK